MLRGHEKAYPRGFIKNGGRILLLVGELYCKQAIVNGKASSASTSTTKVHPTMGSKVRKEIASQVS